MLNKEINPRVRDSRTPPISSSKWRLFQFVGGKFCLA